MQILKDWRRDEGSFTFGGNNGGFMGVEITHGTNSYVSAKVNIADFLAAIASELNVRIVPADAIVIERSELPEVFRDQIVEGVDGAKVYKVTADGVVGYEDGAYEDERRQAVGHLAIAEYLTANPPVDEAQIKSLSRLITSMAGWEKGADFLARDLLATGRVQVTS